jgi:hypothetical protein
MAFLLGQCANAIRKTERVGKPCDNPPQELTTSLIVFQTKPLSTLRHRYTLVASGMPCGSGVLIPRRESRAICQPVMYAVWMTGLRAPTLTKRFPADPKVALHALASSYTVMARNAIFVLLVGGINSDLPGPILAQVRTGLSKAT